MRTALAVSGVFVLLALWTGEAAGRKGPPNHRTEPYSMDAKVKERLEVLSDSKGHYLVLVPFAMCDNTDLEDALEEAFFYGDGKDFWRMRIVGGGGTCGKDWSHTFWEPRIGARWKVSVGFKDNRTVVRCDDRETEVKPVSADEKKKILAQAKFHDSPWDRMPYALARDDRGNYYFVDHKRHADRKVDFRLYQGPRGNLKLQRMKNVVSDSEGDIFATRRGELRLILGKNEAAWIRGKKRTPLVIVPVSDNAPLIYNELGVYLGERLGTPCDDL